MSPHHSPVTPYDTVMALLAARSALVFCLFLPSLLSTPEAAEIHRRDHHHLSCGVAGAPKHGIIGGSDATPGRWPWHVGLHLNGTYLCGGAIIDPEWVVTAAHCIFDKESAYTVRVGDTYRNVKERFEQDYSVAKLIKNVNWVMPQPDSDIALVKLTNPISFNEGVGPVCLPTQDYDVPLTSTCYLSGWGITTIGSRERSLYLQEAEMPPLSNAVCAAKTAGTTDPWLKLAKLTDNMICGGIAGSPLSGCNGDSGGPYVCKISRDRWMLQGTVSWGSAKCDSSQSYSVFTRVSKFMNWINTQMENN